ncbi:acyltransferase domain-containing protein [Archangium violaceum]|uniref:type I polyketide synthase n=1 Tax=Archangium violaceum TaxID=83451 RepID=UPI002B292A18|nr:acyltransferase domain-containing protein [Archangium violaceum]
MSKPTPPIEQLTPLQQALLALREMRAKLDAAERARTEPIAVVGMGCRIPGGANNPELLWTLLRDGVDAIAEVPAERWDIDAYYDPDPDAPGKMYTRHGGFLDAIDRFDAQFFGIAPREASWMDPQQRLLLEVTWEALEHAGIAVDRLSGSPTGVFVGLCNNDYSFLHMRSGSGGSPDTYSATGSALSIASGRISYLLGLQGPCMTVDTACSASLLTVHLACQSLRQRECNLALAGGVNAILLPEGTISGCQLRALAPDGRCKTFDAAANGYVRSEGCGVVVLKRLSDALADEDDILAIIRGSAVNQDGRSGGLTAPNGPAQEDVIRKALARAGVEPKQVGYVEAHGTGTSLGDPIEVRALGAVLGAGRTKEQPLYLGSIKTNVGHLEGAAGIAGLLKVVLMLKHGELPPHLHLSRPNPYIAWDSLPLAVPTKRMPWSPIDGRRIAGVSSFGLSGTNVHVVLEAAPPRAAAALAQAEPRPEPDSTFHLLPLSARTKEALTSLAKAYLELLSPAAPGVAPPLRDVCRSAGVRRSHHEYRLAAVGRSQAELSEQLQAFLRGESAAGLSSGYTVPGERRKVVFVFPGQGSQWIGMGRRLLEQEPVFRAAVERCDEAMRTYLDGSLLEALTDESARTPLERIDILQPALFAFEVALAALWRSWGIEPDAVIGHSMGEVAAAHVAGILSLPDAARIICQRSKLLRRVSGQGAMAVVALSMEAVRRELAGYEDRLAVAVSNSPASTVISGEPAALRELLGRFKERDIFCREVKVDVASHSPQMDPLRGELLQLLAGTSPRTASVPFYSTVKDRLLEGPELDGAYWADNLREPVLFGNAVQRLLSEGHEVFLELSPHPILLTPIEEILHAAGKKGAALPSVRRDTPEHATLLGSLGSLYSLGASVDWTKQAAEGRFVRLPSYPWQKQRFWHLVVESSARVARGPRQVSVGGHPLLGEHLPLARPEGSHVWECVLDPERQPFLYEHRIQGAALLPASVFLEMALAASAEALGGQPLVLSEMELHRALVLPKQGACSVQLLLEPVREGRAAFQIYGRANPAEPWSLHVTGSLRERAGAPELLTREEVSLSALEARCDVEVPVERFYERIAAMGVQLGPSHQRIEHLRQREGEALARLRVSDELASELSTYALHPSLADACFQLFGAISPTPSSPEDEDFVHLPVHIGGVQVLRRPQGPCWAHARLDLEGTNGEAPAGSVRLLDETGGTLVLMTGIRFMRVHRDALEAQSSSSSTSVQDAPGLARIARRVAEAPPARRRSVLLAEVCAEVAGVLGFDPSAPLETRLGFFKMGMDSLTAMKLRKRLEAGLGRSLPPTLVFEYPNIESLTDFLGRELVIHAAAPEVATAGAIPNDTPDELEGLPEDELIALFDREMAALERTAGGKS